ncbi:MAG: IS200/IS605 family accessory protein TnpB-related protein [Sulfolobales archaeon]
MEKLLKILKRTIILEGWTNRFGRQALREISEAYRTMLREMLDYAIEHSASQETLHRIFYNRFREEYPWLPTRVIKGCYRDAVRRAKSFRKKKKKGQARKDKPEIRSITITYSDSQDWRLREGYIELRTHRGWIRIIYRNHKQLHRYLYNNWKPSSELKLKLSNGRILVYLTLVKEFEILYRPGNAVAVDINENNVTLAVFVDRRLHEIYRVETNIGRIVIAYSERRRRIAENRSTRDRVARKALRRLREGERKEEIIYKTARIIEEIARRYDAAVVIGNAHRGKNRMASKASKKNLRHRIHQWCASKLVEILNNKPLYVVEESEAYSSSRDPFSRKPIKNYTPSVIRVALRGGRRVKVIKIQLRLARLSNGLTMDRDMIGAINIGLRYLSPDGRGVAFPSTEPHEVWVKLLIPHQGLTPLTELKLTKNN